MPSRALMQRAGAAVASEIALRYHRRLAGGVLVFTGPGNNGGDGWVIARALAQTGVSVHVIEVAAAKTPDAIAERALALSAVATESWRDGMQIPDAPVVVDALLGTGSTGAPRNAIAAAVESINSARERGADIVAVDLPTGVDATTGDAEAAVSADLTITFGTVKRGHLVARQACGAIVVVDIGLGDHAAQSDGTPSLVEHHWVAAQIPPIAATAHKGTRRKLVVIGGAPGMAGASILAARAAIRSGIGMVRLVVAPESLGVVQSAEPYALAGVWPEDDGAVDRAVASWADGLVIGPGLGHSPATRALVDRVLARFRGPVVLDADALNVFDGDLDSLGQAIGGRPALLTPHPAEFARLAGTTIEHVLTNRFEAGAGLARRTGAVVLLKGVPTVVTAPAGDTRVSSAGTPVLAAAGSGDLLSGIAGTLLTQLGDALVAGSAAAWIHGRAAEMAAQRLLTPPVGVRAHVDATASQPVRGVTLEDVISAIPLGFPRSRSAPRRYPVLLELPAVGERS